jgi:subtilisin family serine protease
MTNPEWRLGLKPEIADEIELIISAFRDAPENPKEISVVPTEGGGVHYMYAEGEILVTDEHLGRVLEILGYKNEHDLKRDEPGRIRRVIVGVVLLVLGEPHPSVVDALNLIDQDLGRGIATPNQVLTVAGGEPTSCPATEPEEVYVDIEPYPSVCRHNGGGGVLVYMADTGLQRDTAATHPWLAGVTVGNEQEDYDVYQPPLPGAVNPPLIPPYTGHGTFVAGVLRCMAPAAEIIVTSAFAIAGSELESDLVPRLEAALGLGADIFHLTISCMSRHDLPLIAFREWLRRLHEYGGAVCVVAAGNSGVRRPSWPAAFAEVISVGALGGDWRGRASFSNFGPWVDVYAPGRDLVNAYTTGTYECHVAPYAGDPRHFYGMAKWSGTSFSTPIVSGLIAARMSDTGENARQAAAAVLAEAQARAIPGVGPVLLPCCHESRAPRPPDECGCRTCRHRPGAC